MKFDIITIFPDQIKAFTNEGVFHIAQKKKLVDIQVHDLRKWTTDKHKTVDDRPFGGGPGMIMKIEPIYKAINELMQKNSKVILVTPKGDLFDQSKAKALAEDSQAHYIILCGHYEGFDERIHKHLTDIELSVGNFVLSGGEIPALIIVDAITRLLPGVLGNVDSLVEETFENDSFEYPQYTRPDVFNKWKVPDILLSGDHKKVAQWKSKNTKSASC